MPQTVPNRPMKGAVEPIDASSTWPNCRCCTTPCSASRRRRVIDEDTARIESGLTVLASVGSTAPFVGLFGTVWGIYHALTAIGIAGQASIDKVAGPVGEALIMTAIGLAVAVPAVLGYNWLVRRNKVTMEAVRSFGSDLHGVLMGAKLAAVAR